MKDKFKIVKRFATLGLAATLALGAFAFVGCEQQEDKPVVDPPKPVKPVEPDPSKPTNNLNTAKKEYNAIVATIGDTNSLTASVESQERTTLFEIQNNNMKQTANNASTFYETSSDGKTFEYSLQNQDWHKTLADGNLTATLMKETIVDTLESTTWAAVDKDGKLTGTIQLGDNASNTATASCTYNKKDNSIALKLPNQAITITNVNNTIVTLPQEYVDDTQEKPVEGFKITAENIEAVKAAMRPLMEKLCVKATQLSTLQDVYSCYLTKSDTSSVVDTIGAVYTLKLRTGTICLNWVEFKIPTQEDISYEKIYKGNTDYDVNATTYKTLYSFSSKDESLQSAEMIDTLKTQTFGEDYKTADWTGWTVTGGMSSDRHVLVMFSDNEITEINYDIYKDNSAQSIEKTVELHFKDQTESNTTYKTDSRKVYELADGNRIFLAIQSNETEQDR